MYDDTDVDRNPRVLRTIADVSGGRAYFPRALADLDRVWRDVAASIRSQYTVGYESNNVNRDGAYRRVRIKVTGNRQGLRVMTRDGYVASGAALPRR